MINKETDSNKNSYKQKSEFHQKKTKHKSKLIFPSFYNPESTDFNSNISEKKNNLIERNNSLCSSKSGIELNIYGNTFFSDQYKYMQTRLFNFPIPSKSNGKEGNNIIKIEPKNFFLNCFENEKEDIYKDKNEEKRNNNIFQKINNSNCIDLYNFSNKNYNLKEKDWMPEKNINLNLNVKMCLNNSENNNNNINISKTKFFTNHNYGYKCSCSKTQCNRKYCECFNSGNYCIDCNCKNCNNKPPINSYTNKHPSDNSSKNKKEKIICTCTKSGCNKNYCECFKSGQKCSELCRCISCENNDEITNKKKDGSNYECCPANSIYIIKNNIFIENINRKFKKEEIKNTFDIYPLPITKENYITISKKRKREEIKNNEQINEKKRKINNNFEVFDLFNDSQFSKNRKIILRSINIIHI